MDSRTHRHIFNQIPDSTLLSHHHYPCHNLTSIETVAEVAKPRCDVDLTNDSDEYDCDFQEPFFDSFPCYTPFPYRVCLSSIVHCGSAVEDEAEGLVSRKVAWMRRLRSLKPRVPAKAFEELQKFRKKDTNKLSVEVMMYLNHFNKDPDPIFNGYYNWFYTGGNLCGYLNEEAVICNADETDSKPTLNVMKLDHDCDKIIEKTKYVMNKGDAIFQISMRSLGTDWLVVTRQKARLTLFNITSDLHVKELWAKKVKTGKLLTSLAINPAAELVATADNKSDINIFDVNARKKTFGCSTAFQSQIKDVWNQVLFYNSNIYFADRNSFYILDHRIAKSHPESIFSPSAMTEKCEVIYNMFPSACNENFIYLATTHKLLLFDIRNRKAVQMWTHLMNFGPQYGQAISSKSEEVIVLQSKSPNEVIGIANGYHDNQESCKYMSKTMPRILRSINETLEAAHFKGQCLNPKIQKRLNFHVTGLLLLKSERDNLVHVFVGSSAGDVSKMVIEKKNEWTEQEDDFYTENRALRSMENYEAHLDTFNFHKPVNATSLIDMSHVYKILQNKDIKRSRYKPVPGQWRYQEMHTMESLVTYRDEIGQKLLKVWKTKEEPVAEDYVVSGDDKVKSWLDQI